MNNIKIKYIYYSLFEIKYNKLDYNLNIINIIYKTYLLNILPL